MAEAPTTELERGAPSFGARPRPRAGPVRGGGEPFDELAPVRRGALGGGRWVGARSSAAKSAIVTSDSCPTPVTIGMGQAWMARTTPSSLKPRVLEGTASPHHEQDVALRTAHRGAEGGRDLLSRALSLDAGRVNDHRKRGKATPEHLEHVPHRGAGR